MIAKYYPRILAVSAVLIFFTNLCLYLYSVELVHFPPLYWIIGLGIAASPLILSRGYLEILRRSLVARWCYGFILISGLWLIFEPSASEKVFQEFQTRLLSVLFILTMLCIFSKDSVQLWGRRAIFGAVLLALALNTFELFSPMTFSEVMGRSAGLYINPNQSAAALILGLVVTIGLVPHRYRMLYVVLVGLGVFLTFSRSSLIGWALTAGVFIKTGQLSVRRSLLVGCGMLCVALALMIWQWDRIQYRLEDLGVLNKNVLARLDWFNNPDVSDMSSTERKEVAEFGWALFSEKPVLGNGLGASVNWAREKSSHNEYLNMMVDHGIIGVFFLPILVLLTQWRARGEVRHIGFAFAIFVLYLGFFSHNVLTERHILMTFALLECMAVSSRSIQANDERLPDEGSSYNHCFAR